MKRTTVVGDSGAWEEVTSVEHQGERLIPYGPDNDLLRSGIVLFPERPEEYGTTSELLGEIDAYIDRYVDVSPRFRRLAAHYVLLTWVFASYDDALDHCCTAWTNLIDQPWRILSIGLRDWAYGF